MHLRLFRAAPRLPVLVAVLVASLAAAAGPAAARASTARELRPASVAPDLYLVGGLSIADEPPTGPSVQQVGIRVQDAYGNDIRAHDTITVDWRTFDWNAHAPGDYTPAGGTLTIPDGEVEGIIDVPIAEDDLSEPTEWVFVLLSNPSGAQLGGIGPGLAFFQINDDDPRPRVSVGDVTARSLPDRPRIMKFDVTLDRPLEDYALVDVDTVDGTALAGVDYLPVSKTVLFPPMVTTKQVWVWVLPGSNGLNFELHASNPVNVNIGDGVGIGYIDEVFAE